MGRWRQSGLLVSLAGQFTLLLSSRSARDCPLKRRGGCMRKTTQGCPLASVCAHTHTYKHKKGERLFFNLEHSVVSIWSHLTWLLWAYDDIVHCGGIWQKDACVSNGRWEEKDKEKIKKWGPNVPLQLTSPGARMSPIRPHLLRLPTISRQCQAVDQAFTI